MKYHKQIFAGAVILILTFGIFIRFWRLDTIPPGIQYDEAFNGINALQALETGNFKVFYSDNFGREGFHINITAFFIKLFGNTSQALRLANFMWGSLTLIGFYFLLRQLKFSKISVLVGTFILATSFWHLDFSRTAYRAIMVPLLIVWSLYFFFKGLDAEKKKTLYFILAGVFLGLGFHTYIAFRIVPGIFIFLAIMLAVMQRGFIGKYWRYAFAFLVFSFLVALPIFVYYADHMKDLLGRSEAVSIMNVPGMTFWQAFGKSLGYHVRAFFVDGYGDGNPRHNFVAQAILPIFWSPIFAFGIAFSLWDIFKNIWFRFKKKEFQISKTFWASIVAQLVFWLMLVPGIMSIEGIPHNLRIIGAIPGTFLIMVLGVEFFVGKFASAEKKKSIFSIMLGLILISVLIGGGMQVYTYFYKWAGDRRTEGGFEKKLYDLGLLVKQLPTHKNNYLVTTWNINISQDRKQSSLKTTEYIGYPNIKQYVFSRPMENRVEISCDDPQIIFQDYDKWLQSNFLNLCPDLKSTKITPQGGSQEFLVITK